MILLKLRSRSVNEHCSYPNGYSSDLRLQSQPYEEIPITRGRLTDIR